MKITRWLAAPVVALVATFAMAAPAVACGHGGGHGHTTPPHQRHISSFSADCDGVVLHAVSYDGNKDNRWSVTIAGVEQHGMFGSTFDQTFAVPQDGKTSSWSAYIEAEDGSYRFEDSGSVGPCGTPPPTDVCPDIPGNQPPGTNCTPPPPAKHPKAEFGTTPYCHTVVSEYQKNIDHIVKKSLGNGWFKFTGYAKVIKGVQALFSNGKPVMVKKVHVKRMGCSGGSSS